MRKVSTAPALPWALLMKHPGTWPSLGQQGLWHMHVWFLFPLSAQRSGTHINQPRTRGAAWQDSPVPAGHLQSPHGHRAEQAGAERAPGLLLSCGCCPGNRSDPRSSAHARLQREFLSPLSCNLQFVRQNQQFLTPMKGHVTFDFTEAFHAHYCNQIKFIPF